MLCQLSCVFAFEYFGVMSVDYTFHIGCATVAEFDCMSVEYFVKFVLPCLAEVFVYE